MENLKRRHSLKKNEEKTIRNACMKKPFGRARRKEIQFQEK